jgi:hypothetical protein
MARNAQGTSVTHTHKSAGQLNVVESRNDLRKKVDRKKAEYYRHDESVECTAHERTVPVVLSATSMIQFSK